MPKFNRQQMSGLSVGDLNDLTKQIKANNQISKGLKEQKERMRREQIKKEILKDIFG